MSEKKKNWKMILAGVISVFLLCSNFLPVSVRAAETEQKNKYVTTLRVAFCPLEGFFEYDASGREVGYGVEFLDAVARYAGIRFTYVKADSWEETKQMLLDGEADIRMPGNLPTEPSDIFQYSNYSVIDTYYAMMTLNTRDDLYFEDYDTFGSLRIGISENQYDYIGETAGFQSLGIDKEQLIFYDGYNACRQALEDGQVDAVISNIMDLDQDMKQIERFSTVSNYIAMLIGSTDMERINEGISELKQNEPLFLSDLYIKWFPDRVAVPFTKEETEYIRNLGSITFSFREEMGGLSMNDEDGAFTGFFPEVAQLVCRKLGVECRQTIYGQQPEEQVYVNPDFYYDYNWADTNGADITRPYLNLDYYEITRRDQRVSKEKSRVAVVEDYHSVQDLINNGYQKELIVPCENFAACIDTVNSGKADITYINRYVAEYYLEMYRYSGLSSSLSSYSHQICMAVFGDDTGMISSIISKTMLTVTSEELDELLLKASSEKPDENLIQEMMRKNPFQSAVLIIGVCALFVILCVLFLFTKKMEKKNLALEEATNARQDFLSRMSHDMRTPMNAIIGFAGFGKESKSLNEAHQYYDKIASAGDYLLQLVNDSLDLTKYGNANYEFHTEEYRLGDFIADITNMISQRAQKKAITFEVDYNEKDEYTLGFDKLRVQQIFVNLLNNAVKFTQNGGHVSLSISHEKVDDEKERVCFTVKDDGIGMSEEFVKNRMFKPFEQEEQGSELEGTGLGLSIVKRLVEAMGGSIRCESILGQGTTFYVNLYGEIIQEKKENVQIPLPKEEDLEGRNILLCEDNQMNREIADRLLKKKGVIVTNAENGKIGLEKFEQSPVGYFDAVLMDIRMPVMDGYETTRKIRSLKRKDALTIPIIALSANTFDKDRKACKEAGMNEHLSKPIEPQVLYATLNRYIQK